MQQALSKTILILLEFHAFGQFFEKDSLVSFNCLSESLILELKDLPKDQKYFC